MESFVFPDKPLSWSDAKNELLKRTRNISFEAILLAMQGGRILDVIPHANKKKYAHQHVYVVEIDREEIDRYVYLVPFVEDEEKIFLKTIIPSRKATRKRLQG
ncbi:MAG: toxin [Candidatus Vogelbacteria bacterium CG10_big_fil_rev_8_21_14_0_10_51_16]|uniref:Toxin n=1 Tax=Candidatus Vogelbacteria bacterium CG10_big_fil_rev_8_21_14_0_10_51_16 TaxID=1975045 RepID=A0A2H0RFT0_9BACT|nr:MAG: toxin [Candidatus Vogelbacteria bacterium CG10_big_fil_rev_8_21_14_0_10_51_16]